MKITIGLIRCAKLLCISLIIMFILFFLGIIVGPQELHYLNLVALFLTIIATIILINEFRTYIGSEKYLLLILIIVNISAGLIHIRNRYGYGYWEFASPVKMVDTYPHAENSRKSHMESLEKILDIKMPTDFKVLNDDYVDVFPNYCKLFQLQLSNNSIPEVITDIKAGKSFNQDSLHNLEGNVKPLTKVDSLKGVWAETPKGFDFVKKEGLVSYTVQLDTILRVLKYSECGEIRIK